jgi:hypothetical protein
MPQVAANYKANKHKGLQIAIVIGEDYSYKAPTLAFCKNYAKQYDLPLERTFIDSGPTYGGWETTFTYIDPYTDANGGFALPWAAVLDLDDMEYLYTSSTDPYFNTAPAIWEAMQD